MEKKMSDSEGLENSPGVVVAGPVKRQIRSASNWVKAHKSAIGLVSGGLAIAGVAALTTRILSHNEAVTENAIAYVRGLTDGHSSGWSGGWSTGYDSGLSDGLAWGWTD